MQADAAVYLPTPARLYVWIPRRFNTDWVSAALAKLLTSLPIFASVIDCVPNNQTMIDVAFIVSLSNCVLHYFPRPEPRERYQLLISLSSERQTRHLFFSVQGLTLLHAVESHLTKSPKWYPTNIYLREIATAMILPPPAFVRKGVGGRSRQNLFAAPTGGT